MDQALGQTGSKSSNSAAFNLVCSVLSLFHSQTTTAHTLCECGPRSLLYTDSSCRWATEEAQLAPDLTSFQVSSYEPRERKHRLSFLGENLKEGFWLPVFGPHIYPLVQLLWLNAVSRKQEENWQERRQSRQKQQVSTTLRKQQTFKYLKTTTDTDIGVRYEDRAQKMQNVWGFTLSKKMR